jgi:glycosyltransferase involved in cell wall biosynthesis
MTDNSPLVSVCIPVYNGVDHIRKAVECALGQTYSNLEVLVQDNSSDDGTWKILEDIARSDPRLLPERNAENIGMAPNWNKVLARAKGDFLAFMNCDDYYALDFVESALKALRSSEAEMVSCNHYNVTGGVRKRRKIFLKGGIYKNFPAILLLFNPFPVVFSVFARSLYSRMSAEGKFFNENFNLTCDYELMMRLACSGVPLFYDRVPRAYYCRHGGNLSKQSGKMTRQALLVILSYGEKLSLKCLFALKFTLLRFAARIFRDYLREGVLDRKAALCAIGRLVRGF